METDKYLGLFIDESKENLQKLNESLLSLEENIEDLEILNDIFRVAHTLKGMSRTMGFNDMADLTHSMENVLEPLRNGTLKAQTSVIDTLFKCLDKLESLVNAVVESTYADGSNNINELIKEVDAIGQSGTSVETGVAGATKTIKSEFNEYEIAVINNAAASGFKPLEIVVTLEDDCVLPAARAFMVVNTMESLGEIINATPSIEDLESGNFEKTFILHVVSTENAEDVQNVIKNISEIKSVEATIINLAAANAPTDQVEQQENGVQIQEAQTAEERTERIEKEISKANSKVVSQTIRVNADRLDKLMNLVGEFVINRTRIAQLAQETQNQELASAIKGMGHITTDLQEIVMKLRMVPIDQVFNRFPRLVRDISKNLNKEINLEINGKETEIDRVVVDEIGDPLMHLIRNSLDHGIESPEERISKGKPPKGTITLSAFNEGDNIIIKVSDDGKGIDAKKIKESAVKKGIITADAAKSLSEKEAVELIFAPGFSTNEVATDISGRGVGMDVVKSKVSTLGGVVSINTIIDKGTDTIISLPSTMAIVQALLLRINDEIYAAPLNYISEVIDIHKSDVKKVQNKEVIVLRGHSLPLIRLDEILEVPKIEKEESDKITIVIIKSQNHYFGAIVTELIGQQEIVIKPIDKKLCSDNYISGATTLGNGKVALIININALS